MAGRKDGCVASDIGISWFSLPQAERRKLFCFCSMQTQEHMAHEV